MPPSSETTAIAPARPPRKPPKYQVLPDLLPEVLGVLKEDMRLRGVQLPVEVTTKDEILDGHQRLRACE
jgi:ParB-like chromosome segregation protein Spo0J